MTSALLRVGGQRHAPAAFTPGKDPVPIVQEAGWAPGPVWISAKNLAPTGIRSQDLPARRQSLYRLSYPGPSIGSRDKSNSVLQFWISYATPLTLAPYFRAVTPFRYRRWADVTPAVCPGVCLNLTDKTGTSSLPSGLSSRQKLCVDSFISYWPTVSIKVHQGAVVRTQAKLRGLPGFEPPIDDQETGLVPSILIATRIHCLNR
jgi:hypothetical protein